MVVETKKSFIDIPASRRANVIELNMALFGLPSDYNKVTIMSISEFPIVSLDIKFSKLTLRFSAKTLESL